MEEEKEDPKVQSDLGVVSAGSQHGLQDGLSFTPLDSNEETVQPFPRSPKLQRHRVTAGRLSEEQLRRQQEELQAEKVKVEAHIQSLKKRRADLSRSTEVMKQQLREHFQSMQTILKQDEQTVLDSLELDLRQTRNRLDQVLKNWTHHLTQVTESISTTQKQLSKTTEEEQEARTRVQDSPPEQFKSRGHQLCSSLKKLHASEEDIRLDKEHFERLLRSLNSISKTLRAQLQRKTLMLDWSPVVIDRQTSHSQIAVTSEGRGLSFLASSPSAPEHPLQFDKVCCALASSPVTAGRHYWEVDVHCCSAWAVGVAYGSLERKGRDKGTKLGRNRNSWCVEFRNSRLSAWHNDRHMVCHGTRPASPGRVGVWVNYNKGQLTFYDAETMLVLQRFSAALTPVFDRAHHQFTEPLYPAMRFLRPPENQMWPNHMEFCSLNTVPF
ncbi:nuclear factor 7, ovary [Thalassophryne amazonica]|uniref:nuclear factor 7, ovary n=1 Tax=Thalassophryne amazonica TaxID=390379 RepID=UPI001470D706|nr:nuclear factor 7, ovary [Thalassophryne amazonica]